VFIPRPETEVLVDWALDRLRAADRAAAERSAAGRSAAERSAAERCAAGAEPTPGRPGPIVVDLCGGSGAIALAVAQESAAAAVYAVERDPDALAWLGRNAAIRAAAGDRPIAVVPGDAADPTVLSTLDGSVDLVLCNPPYVPAGTPVPPEVAEHDPATAVFAGPDGLDAIRPIVARVATLLRPGGWFGVEHDESQAAAVAALLRADGRFVEVSDHDDLAGRPRFATARRAGD
jgi:release factor glutamine methyltransferase